MIPDGNNLGRPTLDDLREENDPGVVERERLERGAPAMAEALLNIHQELSWFFACAGHVNREDMVAMIAAAQKQVDGVREIIWPEDENATEPEPLSNDF